MFVVVCLLVCLCVVLNKGLMGAHLIPQRHRSNLEGRVYERRPQVSVAALADGSFQDSFERYVADGVPWRDVVVLANAAVQRSGISLASGLFGYPAYPTFFGSDYVYVPECDAVLPIALKSADRAAEYSQVHEMLDSLATVIPTCKYPYSRSTIPLIRRQTPPTTSSPILLALTTCTALCAMDFP